jgi:hypothetical protein
VQEDAAHASDRSVAGRHRDFDYFGPARFHNAAHSPASLIRAELRRVREQPPTAHVAGTPCSLAIRSSSAAVPAMIARVFADELDRPVPPRGLQQSGYILLREPRADDARRIAATIAYAGTSRATTLEPGLTHSELAGNVAHPMQARELSVMFDQIPALTANDVADLLVTAAALPARASLPTVAILRARQA